MRNTYTFAELEVSPAAYDEIKGKLEQAGYGHAFIEDAIDMHGIGLTREACAHPDVCTCGKCREVALPMAHANRGD